MEFQQDQNKVENICYNAQWLYYKSGLFSNGNKIDIEYPEAHCFLFYYILLLFYMFQYFYKKKNIHFNRKLLFIFVITYYQHFYIRLLKIPLNTLIWEI